MGFLQICQVINTIEKTPFSGWGRGGQVLRVQENRGAVQYVLLHTHQLVQCKCTTQWKNGIFCKNRHHHAGFLRTGFLQKTASLQEKTGFSPELFITWDIKQTPFKWGFKPHFLQKQGSYSLKLPVQGEFGRWHPGWGREYCKTFFYSAGSVDICTKLCTHILCVS